MATESATITEISSIKNTSDKKRLLFFGTHPNQTNGYSKVVY